MHGIKPVVEKSNRIEEILFIKKFKDSCADTSLPKFSI